MTTSTPTKKSQKPLLKYEDGEEVNVHMYRSMIGSLMYLTSSRPDIMYLKGQPKLGLWYPVSKSKDGKPVWNNAQRVNHQNFAKKTHPCAKKNMVPRAVLMKSGLVSVNTARQVNAAHSKTTMNAARPMSYLSKIAHSTVKRPIHKNTSFKNSNINQRVNTIRGKKINTARPKAVVNAVKGNNFNVVKASACWVWKPKHKVLDHGNPQMDLQDQGVIDSRCSRHMTGNISYLTNYEEIDGGYVAFGGNPKGGEITGTAKKSVRLMMEKLFGIELELILLHALVDGKKVIITEVTIRRDLQLEDEEGVDCLPNSTIFE
ncbi:hypothetical protein Tco_0910183 [Tanacetum coccineum]|uniref:Uncharacterized protein n=1 Tax=Tanacetum coccineum TaxID=301880 RepID=A0ABQ5CVF8_9ASTR